MNKHRASRCLGTLLRKYDVWNKYSYKRTTTQAHSRNKTIPRKKYSQSKNENPQTPQNFNTITGAVFYFAMELYSLKPSAFFVIIIENIMLYINTEFKADIILHIFILG